MKQHLLTQLSTFHSQLSTLNSPFSIILFPLFLAGIASAHADDSWQHIIYEHGFDLAFVANLSESSNIKLAEPRCAFVNITGIDKMPIKKDQDLHAWLECYDGNGKYFKKRVIMNAQGNSSLAYSKKNLSVSFCEDDWEGYLTYPVYSADTTYHAGDRCTLKYRIWTATATTKGIRPYQTIGQTDNLQRVGEWIRDRIALTDEYFKFDPDAIAPFPLGEGREEAFGALEKVRARKVVRAGHFYIIKGSKVFSADGRQIQDEKRALKIY